MIESFNNFDFKKPPMVLLPVKNVVFVVNLRGIINSFLRWESEESKDYAYSAAMLSRIIARRKTSFRRLPGYRDILKINAALCRLLRVDLVRDIKSFYSALPDIVPSDGNVYTELPTRNSFEYILLRIVGVHGIQQRIQELCTEAADYFAKLLRDAFFVEINTLLLAVFAKLFRHSGEQGNKYVELYEQLLPFKNQLPYHQAGNGNAFPKQLEPLQKYLENTPNTSATSQDSCQSAEACIDKKLSKSFQSELKYQPAKRQRDMGVSVNRQDRSGKQKKSFSIAQLVTVEDVQTFITLESKARKKSLKQCITKALLDHEWQATVKLFKRKIHAKEHEKALSVFKKFLSTKL